MNLLPRSLAGRLALLLVLAVVGAQATTFAMFAHATTQVGRAAVRTQVADRVAILVRLLDTVPPDAVPGVISAFSTPMRQFTIGPDSLVPVGTMDVDEARLAYRLGRRVGAGASEARVALVERAARQVSADARDPSLPQLPRTQALVVSVRLDDGRWLNGEAPFALPTPPWIHIGFYQLAASVLAVLVVVALAMRGIVGPVVALAHTAEQAGRGAAVAALPERGPRELRTMTVAFNEMQARLRAFVEDRTRMLAAISHDLRTPIASLWLRTEMVEDVELRGAMVRTLAEMRRMVEATLAFAREDAEMQESGSFDLAALARTLVEEHHVLGREVSLSAPASLPFQGRSLALRRALDNLIENAVRYGGRARLSMTEGEDGVAIRVEDDGPGIPPERMEAMFAPFARLEGSRSEETGGSGLGLAIARSAVRAHGGEIMLANRPGGGLMVGVTLPTGLDVRSRVV